MPSTIEKCKLFRIKHTILLEGEIFLRNKRKIAFFLNKCTFLVEKKTPFILYMGGGTYSLKSIKNDRFLRNFS